MKLITDLVQVIVEYLFYLIPYPNPSNEELDNVKIVAHRGWHDNESIMENTMLSFQKALEHKLFAIEFDIRWTKDLVPVVIHDTNLLRLYNQDTLINEINFNQLRTQFPDVPALGEVVSEFGGKIHFFIELKEEYYPNLMEQRKTLNQILAPLKEKEDFHFLSLSMVPTQLMSDFSKESIVLVANTNIKEMSQLSLEHNLGGVAGHYLLITKSMQDEHERQNQVIGSGFPRSMNVFKREINRKAKWIFTNHPWILLGCIKRLKKE